jgi:hypothetical protein
VQFATSGTTFNNRNNHTKIAGRHGMVTLVCDTTNVFYLGGDTIA